MQEVQLIVKSSYYDVVITLEKLYGEDWRTPREEKGGVRNTFRLALKLARGL